jgi:hypothetical protein
VLWLAAPALLGLILGIVALRRFLDGNRTASVWYAVISVLVFYPTVTAGMGPHLEDLWVSPRAAELVARNSLPDDPPVSAAGYTEPSLMFLMGTPTHLLPSGAGAAETVADAGGLALIEDSERAAFLARLAELEGDAENLGELDGYNYSRGRKVHITLYRTRAVPRVTAPPEEE